MTRYEFPFPQELNPPNGKVSAEVARCDPREVPECQSSSARPPALSAAHNSDRFFPPRQSRFPWWAGRLTPRSASACPHSHCFCSRYHSLVEHRCLKHLAPRQVLPGSQSRDLPRETLAERNASNGASGPRLFGEFSVLRPVPDRAAGPVSSPGVLHSLKGLQNRHAVPGSPYPLPPTVFRSESGRGGMGGKFDYRSPARSLLAGHIGHRGMKPRE